MALDFRNYQQSDNKKMGGIDYANAPLGVQLGGMIGQYLGKGDKWLGQKWDDVGGFKGIGDFIKSPLNPSDLKEGSSVAPADEIGQTYEVDSPVDYTGDSEGVPAPVSEEVAPSLLSMVNKGGDRRANNPYLQQGNRTDINNPGYARFSNMMASPTEQGGLGGGISDRMLEQIGLPGISSYDKNSSLASQITNKQSLKSMLGIDAEDYDQLKEFQGYFKKDGSLDYNMLSDKHKSVLNKKMWQRLGSSEQGKYADAAVGDAGVMAPINVTAQRPAPVSTNLLSSAVQPTTDERRQKLDYQNTLGQMTSQDMTGEEGMKIMKALGISQEDYVKLFKQRQAEERSYRSNRGGQ